MEDFTLDLTSDDVSKVAPNAGGAFHRIAFGDYDWEITDVEQETKTGQKPHVMLNVTFKCVKAHDDKNAEEIGQMINGRYAGSPQSPKFMQQRLANLLLAAKVQIPAGQKLKKSMLIGRKLSASVIWVVAKPYMNQETGETTQSVFANLIGERPIGAQRPGTVDPVRDSAKAAKFVRDQYGDGADDEETETPPWANPSGGVEADAAPATATSSYRDEAEAATDPSVHQYRAHVALKTPHAELARTTLVNAGWDPEGPVNVDHLGDMKGAYLAAFPPASTGLPGLPALGAAPSNGATGAAPAKPRTGTRQARTT